VFSGCVGTEKPNTDTPVNIKVGTLTSAGAHSLYLSLYDSHNRQTTADGVADVSFFKGKFQDYYADKINQFVFSQTYNIKSSEFKKETISFRGVKSTELVWSTSLPEAFKPEVGDAYKISIAFRPNEKHPALGNMTYIVWA
jgi:hypothetical protein